MPGKPRKHIVTLAGVVAAVQTFAVLLATRAAAEPSPSPSDDSDCNLLTGSAKKYCEKGDKSGGPPTPPTPWTPPPPSPEAAPTPPPGSSASSPSS